jgi:hypothetical protein
MEMVQVPGIGRIVLFKTVEGDRPMIITRVWSEVMVNGIVFLDGQNDSPLSKTLPGMRMGNEVWMTSRERGQDIGQWRFYDD